MKELDTAYHSILHGFHFFLLDLLKQKLLLDSLVPCVLGDGFVVGEGAKDNILICVEFKISSARFISEKAKFLASNLSGPLLPSSVTPEKLAKKYGIVVGF